MNIVTFHEYIALSVVTDEYIWFECLSCKCFFCKNIKILKPLRFLHNSCKCGHGHDMSFVINDVGKILICA